MVVKTRGRALAEGQAGTAREKQAHQIRACTDKEKLSTHLESICLGRQTSPLKLGKPTTQTEPGMKAETHVEEQAESDVCLPKKVEFTASSLKAADNVVCAAEENEDDVESEVYSGYGEDDEDDVVAEGYAGYGEDDDDDVEAEDYAGHEVNVEENKTAATDEGHMDKGKHAIEEDISLMACATGIKSGAEPLSRSKFFGPLPYVEVVDDGTVRVVYAKEYDSAIECPCHRENCKALIAVGTYAALSRNSSRTCIHCGSDQQNWFGSKQALKNHVNSDKCRKK